MDNGFYNFNDFKHERNFISHTRSVDGLSRCKRRKIEFAEFQYLVRKSRNLAARQLFDGKRDHMIMDKESFRNVWENIMFDAKDEVSDHIPFSSDTFSLADVQFWNPITLNEIHRDSNKSPGPDGLKAGQVWRTPRLVLCRLLNIFMAMGGPPRFCGIRVPYS